MEFEWTIANFFSSSASERIVENYAILILNRPILNDKNLIFNLWKNAKLKVTVDGGTDRWLNFIKENNFSSKLEKPDLITGDFDSVSINSLKQLEDSGSKVIHTPDQNETDFTKSLKIIFSLATEYDLQTILVIADTSGRIDQIIANINTLFKVQSIDTTVSKSKSLQTPSVYILSSNSLSWLLIEGNHKIQIPKNFQERWCAVMPIGGSCHATTKGLKWNMDNTLMEYGGLISTSNTYEKPFSGLVEITIDNPVLWSMGISQEE